MNQTRLESVIERIFDLITGFLISWTLYAHVIYPHPDHFTPFWATMMFTVVSFFRGYFWRRFFNNGIHKLVHQFLSNNKSKIWLLKRK